MFDPGHPQLGEYLAPFALKAPLHGGGIGEVVESTHPSWSKGDVLCVPFLGYPWERHVAIDANSKDLNVHNLTGMAAPYLALGALGMPGLTAYFCMLSRGDPKPGETVC
jgi:NADPH-dependent curcumin reductase CurA